MSDIPVGSPPVPPGRHAAPSGWYPDPTDQRQQRYWDGWQWARNTRGAAGAEQGSPSFNASPSGGYLQPPQQGSGGYPAEDQSAGSGYPSQQSPAGYSQQAPNGGYGYPPQQGAAGGYQYPPQQGGYPYPPQQGPSGYPAVPGRLATATADGVPLAGWWIRVLASIIDSVIIGFIAALPSSPIYLRILANFTTYVRQASEAAQNGLPTPPAPSAGSLMTVGDQWFLAGISVLVGLVYHALFLRWKSATPGLLACRLRVVPVDQGRATQKLPWNTILVRVAIWVLPGISSALPGALSLLGVFSLVNSLFPLWQPKRQALHDLAAKTQVVKVG